MLKRAVSYLGATVYGQQSMGMTALTRSAKDLMCLPRRGIPPRMAGSHRQAPKPEPARQCVDAALGQVHMKPRLDHAGGSPAMPGGTGGQIHHPAPTHHAIHGKVWASEPARLPLPPDVERAEVSVRRPFGCQTRRRRRLPAGIFPAQLPAHGKKRPLQGLGHGRVNDVSKCVKPASLNPSVPVVK